MRISYLYIKNCKPIYNGTGKREVEIDLINSNNLMVLLNGENGSGKSTISDAMSPFAQEVIIGGKNGEKKITFEHGSYIWMIHHIYTAKKDGHTTKSYMCKTDLHTGDVIQLNENGNTTSFKEMVKLELGVDEASIQLVKLGRDINSLINMRPQKRKEFIINFTKEADIFIHYNRKISDDCRILQKTLNTTNTKLDNLGSIESLTRDISIHTSQINMISEELRKLEKIINFNELTTHNMQNSDDMKEYDILSAELNIMDIPKNIDMSITPEELSKERNNIILRLQSQKDNLLHNDKIIDGYTNTQMSLHDERAMHSESLDRYNNISNINKSITSEIEKLKKDIHDSVDILRATNGVGGISSKLLIRIAADLDNFNDRILVKMENVDTSDLLQISHDYDIGVYRHKVNILRGNHHDTSVELESWNSVLYMMAGANELRQILSKRPSGCTIADCPFIAHAISKASDVTKYDKASEKVKYLTDKLDIISGEIETNLSIISLIDSVLELNSYIQSLDSEVITFCNMGGINVAHTIRNITGGINIKYSDKVISKIGILEERENLVARNNRLLELEMLEKDQEVYNMILQESSLSVS